ncbi:MAG: hypothetical protein II161_06095 [Erysipelotrichaceae bacterium]|nr:hypothetical protein [Erysipelotrichaceae bacterium]
MEKVESFKMVIRYLKDREILMTASRQAVWFDNGQITINSPKARYHLSLDDFIALYEKETFYLYKRQEESIDPLKDEEYYRWKNTNAN